MSNVERIASKMAMTFLDSPSVISFILQSLQSQANQVVLEDVEHVKGWREMVPKDNADMSESHRCQSKRKPTGGSDD